MLILKHCRLGKRFFSLNLEQADKISSAVVNVCKRNSFQPIIVTIINKSGNVIVTKSMDGVIGLGYPEFSYAKAYTAIVTKGSSRQFRDKYTSDNSQAKFGQMISMVNITNGKMAPFPGGIALKVDGEVIGAVGCSGASGDEDEYCAIRGVQECGFDHVTTVPVSHSCTTTIDDKVDDK
jgi:uncharacterized protein GlcG (DUF336 family)